MSEVNAMFARRAALAAMVIFGAGMFMHAPAATTAPSTASTAAPPLASLQKQAATGDAAAEVKLGTELMKTRNPADETAAVAWFLKSAAQGNADGEWELGRVYFTGAGVSRNMAAGLAWMHRSLSKPHPSADHMAKYGVLLGMSGDFFSNNHGQVQEGARWLRRGAESGSTLGMLMLGDELLIGMPGIPKDQSAGEHWLLKASRLGDANAQYVLGVDYTFGGLLPPNTEAGIHWLRAAAEQGWVGAQGMLGYLLVSGDKHVPMNLTEGVQWAEKAATAHNPFGYYALGLAYEQGLGGKPVNPAKAWYNFAAAQHTDTNQQLAHVAHDVATHLSEVGGELSSTQLETLQTEVSKIPLPKQNQQS